MEINQLEQLLRTLPKMRLSTEADLGIRAKLTACPTPVTAPAWRWRFEFSIPRFVLAPALAALVLFGSTSVYAYTSPQVTRTSPFYPLKRGLERARAVTARSAARRATTALDFAERRVAEAQVLNTRNDAAALAVTLRETTIATEDASRIVGSLGTVESLERALKTFEPRAQQLRAHLDDLAVKVPTTNATAMDHAALALATVQRLVEQTDMGKLDLEVAAAEGRHEVTLTIPVARATDIDHDADELMAELEAATDDFQELKSQLIEQARPVVRAREITRHLEQRLTATQVAIQSGNLAQARALLRAAEALSQTSEQFLGQ